MHLYFLAFLLGGHCYLSREKTLGRLRATWTDSVGLAEAGHSGPPYWQPADLLNDSSVLRGPWFESLE